MAEWSRKGFGWLVGLGNGWAGLGWWRLWFGLAKDDLGWQRDGLDGTAEVNVEI